MEGDAYIGRVVKVKGWAGYYKKYIQLSGWANDASSVLREVPERVESETPSIHAGVDETKQGVKRLRKWFARFEENLRDKG